MDSGLKGRAVIVAGASQGMGRAAAEAFAREGANLAICARSAPALEQAANEIQERHGVKAIWRALDVTSEEAVAAFVDHVAAELGAVEVCVANAGGPPARDFLSATLEEWQHGFQLNFLSVVHFARKVIPLMQQQRWGRFITITSVSVRQPIPNLVLSNSIRPAVVGLVKSLAQEFGRDGITVNNVAPGYTDTERLKELAAAIAPSRGASQEQIYSEWAADIPMGRLGRPEEIADVIVWLASERAAYITGQTIVVDGGKYSGM